MQEFISSVRNLLTPPYSRRDLEILGFLGLVIASVILLIAAIQKQNLLGRAAEPDKLEVEGGTLSSTGVQKLSDTSASGGQYVLFANVTNTPTPTPITNPSTPTPGPTSPPPPPGLRAFPEAEGFGKNTIGGRGGRVIYVTNLNDSGAGSLREALLASGPRTVLFKVSGTITLNSDIFVQNPFLTIAGQSAPGEGVQIKRGMIKVRTHDVIVRYLKVRSGDEAGSSSNPSDTDPISLIATQGEIYNVIIDHSSLVWGPDIGGISMLVNVHDSTVQNSILGEGLYFSRHAEGIAAHDGHSMAASVFQLLNYNNGWPKKITHYNNLYTTSNNRNPAITGAENMDFVNNIVYNFGKLGGHGAPRTMNFMNNMYIKGPLSATNTVWFPVDWHISIQPDSVFESGNVASGMTIRGGPSSTYRTTRVEPFSVSALLSPQQAYDKVVADVGANKNVSGSPGGFTTRRDSVDTRIINNLVNRTGNFFWNGSCSHCTTNQVSWPTLASGSPYTDSDNDGMSDSWESANFGNLSRGGATNSSSDFDGDGYTDLEEYLNNTNPKLSN